VVEYLRVFSRVAFFRAFSRREAFAAAKEEYVV
jgi:hypothetical protein